MIFKKKLDKLYIDVFVEDKRGISRGRHMEVQKLAKKNIYKITTHTGQIIIVEVSL